MTPRTVSVGLMVLIAVAVGFLGGRLTAPTCTDVRDEYAALGQQIRGDAEFDLDEVDPEFVRTAADLVARRPDCFGTQERDNINRIKSALDAGS